MFNFVAAQTVVQIIGLAVVTAGNPGIDIVMPRVQSLATQTAPAHSIHAVQSKVPADNVGPRMIDDHTAILVFRDLDVATPPPGADWNVLPLPQLGADESISYSYVALDGDHLRFFVNGSNPVATVPATLPRLSFGCRSSRSLALPSKGRRPAMVEQYQATLNAGYQPPAYPHAAAVLKLSAGMTSACAAKVNNTQNGRVDTRIILENDGTVILQATKNGTSRTLSFHGTSIVDGEATLLILANVPNYWLASTIGYTASAVDIGHYQAYYSMLDPNAATNCKRQPPAAGLSPCGNTLMKLASGAPRSSIPPLPNGTDILTYECSNSQYP